MKDLELSQPSARVSLTSRHDSAEIQANSLADVALHSGTPPPRARRVFSQPAVRTPYPKLGEQLQGGVGRHLDTATLARFEDRLGFDLSKVRIHDDESAARSASRFEARAWSLGSHVMFGRGQFSPNTVHGSRLLAHELAHVALHPELTDRVLRAPEEERPWQPDKEGGLYYKTEVEAQRRRAQLEDEAKWEAFRVVSFERNSASFWRVEMRGRKKAPAPQTLPSGQVPTTKSQQGESQDANSPPLLASKSSGRNRIFSLTFDDGPHSSALGAGTNRTEKVLDALKAKGVQGAFFIQTGVSFRGASAAGKSLVARMHAEGHKVGIHTGGSMDHEAHTKSEKAGRLGTELSAAKDYIEEQTGQTPKLVRPPFGSSDARVGKTYATLSLTNVLWDIDGDKKGANTLPALKARLESINSKDPGIPAVQARGWTGTTPSAPKIVLLYHDVREATADNIGDLIDHIKVVTAKSNDTATFAPP